MNGLAGQRGAAIPETALVMASVLAMVFGIVQIGIIGFLQIMCDGAAFVAAHEYALGNTAYRQYTQRLFPQAANAPYIDPNQPDPVQIPVNYHTNLATQRQGGVSLVRPTHLQATLRQSAPGGMFGGLANLLISGAAIEPLNQVSNDVYDAAGSGYSGSSGQSNYATDAQNAPYNYISQHQFTICPPGATINTVHIQGCPSTYQVRSLGTAEFIDHDNWSRVNLGATGPYLAKSTFAEMVCHQQMYASAAAQFFPWQTAWSYNGNPQTRLKPISTTDTSTPVGKIYSWDVITSHSNGDPFYGANPLHPENYC